MTNSKTLLWLLITLLLSVLILPGCGKKTPAPAQAVQTSSAQQESSNRKILVIHSYNVDYEWVVGINRGIQMAITPQDADLHFACMDTKNKTSEEWKLQVSKKMLDIVEEWKPNVVILTDDNAQEYVGRHLIGREDLQVVFGGVNADHKKYGYTTSNVTGILERPLYTRTLSFLKKLQPDINKVVMISDYSPTSINSFEYMKTQDSQGIEVVDWVMPKTFDEWKQTVEKYKSQVDAVGVYTYHTVKESVDSETNVTPNKVMSWTVDNASVPVFGFLVFAIDDGSFCGVLESAVEVGMETGKIALEILEGKKASDIPVRIGTHGQTMVNMETGDKLGLSINEDILKEVDVIRGR